MAKNKKNLLSLGRTVDNTKEQYADIQNRAHKKDKKFVLKGKWKKFVREQNGLKIYYVDGTWIRNNINVIFGHAGHGYVHEFIPLDEVWIATHHWDENKWNKCECENIVKNQKISEPFFESSVVHEISEFKNMKKGMKYWQAHKIAIKDERKAGLIKHSLWDIKASS